MLDEIKIFSTSFYGEDVVECMSDDLKKKFKELPVKKQYELLEKHCRRIGQGLKSGLMSDWIYVMKVAISNTDLEKDVGEAS